MQSRVFFSCLYLIAGCAAFAEEPEADPSELPRIPATEPADVISTFEIHPGFSLEIAAHEPEVADPIAMAFDEKGGLYVVEMRGYSERRDDALGRIRYLTDTDGDGTFDKSTVFREGLKWPTAVLCYKGGVFVAATPDLYYFRDTDGDQVSDEAKTVFTGFGEGNLKLNMQALFNSLRWGPDNRIWGATARNGGKVTKPGDPGFGEVSVSGADFSFDPEKLDLRAENGTAQYGMSFDSLGRRFVCSNSRHAIWVAWERSDLLKNPFYSPPSALVDIPDDGAAAPVFRISEDEPWRIIRTRWRVSGVVKGVVEGGGRVSGYFTSATGIHLYWGTAFGDDYQNNLFVGDVGSNLVHRKILQEQPGMTQPLATRASGEETTEFLRSKDNWFRPVSFSTGPDGCLYICDMYRETIEHPWSLPEGIKKHLDLNSGNDRGRIYRVTPDGFARPKIPDLSKLTDAELLELTSHPNDWHQTTAHRLLYERGNPAPRKALPSPFPALLASEDSLIDHLSDWGNDPWKRVLILNSLRTPEAIENAWQNESVSAIPEFAVELSNLTGRSGDAKAIDAALTSFAKLELGAPLVERVSALKKGIRYRKADWKAVERDEKMQKQFDSAAAVITGSGASGQEKIVALRLIGLQDGAAHSELLKSIITTPENSEELVTEAISGISDTAFLIQYYGRIPSSIRSSITGKMASKPAGAKLLLEAISDKSLSLADVPAETVQLLRDHPDKKVQSLATKVLPAVESRDEVVQRYQTALKKQGDPSRGEEVFKKVCVTCHQTFNGEGFVLGPPIATFKTAGADSILGNVLDPNKEIAPQYQAFQFTLKDGQVLVGMIESEDSTDVTLRLPGGIEKTFPRTDVETMAGVGRSLMPEGLEGVISVDDMSDLLAYLTGG